MVKGADKGPGKRADPKSLAAAVRKLIEFDAETWHALRVLSGDSMKTLQELAEEAIADLLRKHGRPVGLKQALRESARGLPANDAPAHPPLKKSQR
jgi:hypothetical protein